MARNAPDASHIVLRPGSLISRMSVTDLADIARCSEGHARRVQRGEAQIGEAMVASILLAKGGAKEFATYFTLADGRGTIPIVSNKPENAVEYDWPTSWDAALARNLHPEQGPLIPGSEIDYQDDRIVLHDPVSGNPVLAFQENGNLRTYPTTKMSSAAMSVIRFHGVEDWVGTTIVTHAQENQ